MPEKEAAQQVVDTWVFWTDRQMWAVVAMCVVGYIGRVFASNERIEPRRLVGEAILTLLGGIALYAGGLLQSLSPVQMVLMGALGGMGGVHAAQLGKQLLKQMRQP